MLNKINNILATCLGILIPIFFMFAFFIGTSCASSAMVRGDIASELWYLFWTSLSLIGLYKWLNN